MSLSPPSPASLSLTLISLPSCILASQKFPQSDICTIFAQHGGVPIPLHPKYYQQCLALAAPFTKYDVASAAQFVASLNAAVTNNPWYNARPALKTPDRLSAHDALLSRLSEENRALKAGMDEMRDTIGALTLKTAQQAERTECFESIILTLDGTFRRELAALARDIKAEVTLLASATTTPIVAGTPPAPSAPPTMPTLTTGIRLCVPPAVPHARAIPSRTAARGLQTMPTSPTTATSLTPLTPPPITPLTPASSISADPYAKVFSHIVNTLHGIEARLNGGRLHRTDVGALLPGASAEGWGFGVRFAREDADAELLARSSAARGSMALHPDAPAPATPALVTTPTRSSVGGTRRVSADDSAKFEDDNEDKRMQGADPTPEMLRDEQVSTLARLWRAKEYDAYYAFMNEIHGMPAFSTRATPPSSTTSPRTVTTTSTTTATSSTSKNSDVDGIVIVDDDTEPVPAIPRGVPHQQENQLLQGSRKDGDQVKYAEQGGKEREGDDGEDDDELVPHIAEALEAVSDSDSESESDEETQPQSDSNRERDSELSSEAGSDQRFTMMMVE